MAITFVERIKKQKILVYIFLALILITILIVWKGYFGGETIEEGIIVRPVKIIEIDFEVLKHPLLGELEPMEKIGPIEPGTEIGKENPFLPY